MADARSVSVVIPAFNEAGAIAGVIAGLTAAATWHEILVVDDGSTDDTGAIAAKAGARVIRHPYTKGNGAAVKTGIRAATGEYLMVIDGGRGQLGAALKAMREVGLTVPAVGLAKKQELIFLPLRGEPSGEDVGNDEALTSPDPVVLPMASPGLTLLRRLRDEAHRFAQSYHHTLRRKATFEE